MKHLIFHLNILAGRHVIRESIQKGVARMLGEIYDDEQAWFSAYGKVLFDWDSYHADLNFSGDDGMANMREARFRIMRALFRIAGKPEPSQDEIHALADKALKAIDGDVFSHDIHKLLTELYQNHSITVISYLPVAQLDAIIKAAQLQEAILNLIGGDTFEQFDMNRQYFEILLKRLKAKPEECLYIDKQEKVLEEASQAGIKILATKGSWMPVLKNYF